jgi:hypothetical protein
VNSITKKILAIIASGALPALALAAPGGGGAAIGPVNGSGTQGPQTTNTAQKTAVQQTNTGSIPPNAQSGMSGGKQTTSVKAKSKATSKTTTNTGGQR